MLHTIIKLLEIGLGIKIKMFGLLLPTLHERRPMMQVKNHAKNKTKLGWRLNQKVFAETISKFQIRPNLFASRLSA